MKGFIVVALLGALTVSIEGSKCDQAIIAKIKKLNPKIPADPIADIASSGKGVIVAATPGFFPDNVKCIISTYSKESFTAIRVLKNGCPDIKVLPVKNMPGGSTIPGQLGIKRYHVIQNGVVLAMYRCEDNGKVGKPEGLVRVIESTKDHSAQIKEAKEVMKCLGIYIGVGFPSVCP